MKSSSNSHLLRRTAAYSFQLPCQLHALGRSQHHPGKQMTARIRQMKYSVASADNFKLPCVRDRAPARATHTTGETTAFSEAVQLATGFQFPTSLRSLAVLSKSDLQLRAFRANCLHWGDHSTTQASRCPQQGVMCLFQWFATSCGQYVGDMEQSARNYWSQTMQS